MKKALLFTALAACGLGAMAADYTPTTLENFFGQKISPNGRYLVSNIYGMTSIYDSEANHVVFQNDIDLEGEINFGNGNCISNTGMMVGSMGADLMMVINDNKVVVPAWAEEITGGFNGITPDGSIICGCLYQDGYLSRPYIFTVDASGNIGEPVALPFPEKDMLGTRPQHVNVNFITADGTMMAGHVVDDSGRFCIPIVYKKGADGEWSYSYPSGKLFNPNDLSIPAYPEDAPEWVNPEDYLSPEGKAAYDEQMQKYYDSDYDPDLYPNLADYMTPEEIEAYNTALEKYDKEAEIYNNALQAYFDAIQEISDTSVNFVFNSVRFDQNGKYLVAASEIPGETYWDPDTYVIYRFDLENDTYEVLKSTESLQPTFVLDNGTVLAATPLSFFGGAPQAAYIYDPAKKEMLSFADYLTANNNAAMAEWLNTTLTAKDVEVGYDPETFDPIFGDLAVTGQPFGTPDGIIMGGAAMPSIIPEMEEIWYYTYIFTDVKSGISNVAIDSNEAVSVKALKGGVILVEGEVAAVSVYDMSGRQVYYTANVDSAVNTGLSTGIYVVKAIAANGAAVTAKVIF